MSQVLWPFHPAAAAGERITPVLVGDQPLDLAGQYAVVVNSFLASGGDNFTTLAQGSNPRDSGRVDLQAFVDYMAEFSPASPALAQPAVGARAVLPEGGRPRGTTASFAIPAAEVAGPACTVDYQAIRLWPRSMLGLVTVANTGTDPVADWELAWQFTNRERATFGLGATVRQRGSAVTATNAWWNSTLDPRCRTVAPRPKVARSRLVNCHASSQSATGSVPVLATVTKPSMLRGHSRIAR